ncbi:MAG: hypothetical protein ABJN40_15675 [Sneathiella sp.]
MSNSRMNNLVAKELSEALTRCKTNGVDEQSMRTGLLTITIANFVNRIGMDNTIALFQELPGQIASGIFDRYIDPNTNVPRSMPNASQQPQASPYPPQQQAPYPAAPQPQMPPPSYQNPSMPTNFIQPHPGYPQPVAGPQPPYTGSASQPQSVASASNRRRLVD